MICSRQRPETRDGAIGHPSPAEQPLSTGRAERGERSLAARFRGGEERLKRRFAPQPVELSSHRVSR